ncbi:hypothetical protein IMCC1933_11940 [Rhodobacteraceae bacterium IMCC1933]|nr:hypothetical protein [Rhodobacteraceae bacterium IMCC1923]MDP4067649.1 hypothetical protein [Rhodobacteraceae bacterium IMCC1933]MDP4070849.1 hypothetical protein [Rhodobacteraceae bacterium IMCC1909]
MEKLLIALAVLVAGVSGLYWAFPTLFFVIHHNNIYTTEFRVEDNKLHMSGLINSYTQEQLKDIFGEHPEIDTIVLGQMPGSIDDGANLEGAAWVAARGVNTYLPREGSIASGAPNFFLVGKSRVVEEGAVVSVHSWAEWRGITAQDLPRDDSAHELYIGFYESIGWTRAQAEDFYFFTIEKAPAEYMYVMTPQEMLATGVATKIVPATN